MNSWAATVLAVAGVLAFIVFLIPPLHAVAWISGLVLVCVIAVALFGFSKQWEAAQARIDKLNDELAQSYANIGGVTLTDLEQSHPNPDVKLATRIRELFPQDSGFVQHLRINLLTNLDQDMITPLTTFLTEYEHSSFFDTHSHYAFMELFRAGKRVHDWVEKETSVGQDGKLSVISGDERSGGWQEFSATTADGEKLASAFVSARTEFERAVLTGGIIH